MEEKKKTQHGRSFLSTTDESSEKRKREERSISSRILKDNVKPCQ
jgi:hypothetical protein